MNKKEAQDAKKTTPPNNRDIDPKKDIKGGMNKYMSKHLK